MEAVDKFTVLVVFVNMVYSVRISNTQSESDLHKSLLTNYNPNIVPRNNHYPININISFNFMALLRLDEREETLISAAWLSMTWKDSFLAWPGKPEFENITGIFLQQKQIWKPDIYLINTVEHYKSLGSDDLLVAVEPNGKITWEPGHRFKTACSVNIRLYPFDNQKCFLKFSTWMHADTIVRITSVFDKMILDTYEENGEWEITSTKAEGSISKENGYGISQFTVTITLQRRRMYYVMTVCVPIIVLSILNCMVFVLPPDSGEKISFCLTILLAYMVYMSFLSDSLPRTSKTTSHLVVYVSLMICLSFLSVFNSVIVLFFWHKPVLNVKQANRSKYIGHEFAAEEEDSITAVNTDHKPKDSLAKLRKTLGKHFAKTHCGNRKCVKNTQLFARNLDTILFVSISLLTLTITSIVVFRLLHA